MSPGRSAVALVMFLLFYCFDLVLSLCVYCEQGNVFVYRDVTPALRSEHNNFNSLSKLALPCDYVRPQTCVCCSLPCTFPLFFQIFCLKCETQRAAREDPVRSRSFSGSLQKYTWKRNVCLIGPLINSLQRQL